MVPEFWKECVPKQALKRPWSNDLDLTDAPALVHELKNSGLWLEQETIILDPRLPTALEEEAHRRAKHDAERHRDR